MNNTHLPPLPAAGTVGPEVCELVQRYLAVWDDLSPEQKQSAAAHVDFCTRCASTQRLMHQATRLIAQISGSTPSPRVDRTVMTVINAHAHGHRPRSTHPFLFRSRQGSISLRVTALAVAAVLAFAVLAGTYFLRSYTTLSPQQAFVLPATLSWAGYVLYQTETRIDKQGQRYHVNCYYDLKTGHMHVETVQAGMLDVVAVSDAHKTLGMDEMHRVAQWGANEWIIDESMFNLPQLHRAMQAKRAVYLGTDEFRGQKVYRIRSDNGLVLLLNMHYLPVNVLRGAVGPGTGEPVYDSLSMLLPSQVAGSAWEMRVPAGFQMGKLPERP